MSERRPLRDGWSLHLDADPGGLVPAQIRAALPIPATVPGVVHTDLLTAGLIADPHLDRNELDVDWIGRVAWRYELDFDAVPTADRHYDLAFDGLDTVAAVELNGVRLANTENMHRRYRVRVTDHLRPGTNRLMVRFASPVEFGEAERQRMGDLPSQYPGPFNYMRKMACNFGWDWGPVLVTAGIWREVRLESWRSTRLSSARPAVTVEREGLLGVVDISVELAEPAPAGMTLAASVADSTVRVQLPAGASQARIRLEVDRPALWWPRGLGPQPLYLLAMELADESGIADEWSQRIGFRTIELDTAPDGEGSRFELRINETLLPVRGANWIPDDCFPSRLTEARLRERIAQAADAGINLLRVWGGGTYESEEFYRICDELGMTVWQDFLFACAAYPEDARLAAEVDAEARDNVERLMPHPSLILWNGNNENIWGFHDWQWQDSLDDRPWGLGYYLELLPAVVAEVDPTRPYWPGSPYSGSMEIHPNDDHHGTMHSWEVWNQRDYAHYRDARPRFVAEFGWQAPPTWSTILRSIHDDPLTPESPGMLHHQRAKDGQGKLTRGLTHHLPVPASFDDWLLATQITQARALSTGLEYFRSLRPTCTGAIVWQLNDCWPVTSWALVDGYGRKKPAWYAVRAAFADRLLTIQPTESGLELVAVSDLREPWSGEVRIRRLRLDGSVLSERTARFDVAPLGTWRILLDTTISETDDPSAEFILAETDAARALWHFTDHADLSVGAPIDARASRRLDGQVELELHSPVLVRDVAILPDRIAPEADAEHGLLTLLPGERRTVVVHGVPAGREHELTAKPVLRSIADVILASRDKVSTDTHEMTVD